MSEASWRANDGWPVKSAHAVFLIIALAIAGVLWTFALNRGIPFTPTTVKVYTIEPDVLCPGEAFRTITGLDVVKPKLGVVTTFSVDSDFVSEAGARIPLQTAGFLFEGEYGYILNKSPVLRYAPTEPGVWHLETALTTHGKQALRLASDTITGIVSNKFIVRRYDPSCDATTSG